jgi:hypothetical protein
MDQYLQQRKIIFHYNRIFLDPVWLFQLPAMTLILGLLLIAFFIIHTNNKIANAKAAQQAKARGEKTQ